MWACVCIAVATLNQISSYYDDDDDGDDDENDKSFPVKGDAVYEN